MSLHAILGPDFSAKFREATRLPGDAGYYDNVCEEDRPPPETVGIAEDIPMPRDPFRQLSSDEE